MTALLRAGLLLPIGSASTCPHCSRPLAGAAERCGCGMLGWGERRGPGHGVAGVFA